MDIELKSKCWGSEKCVGPGQLWLFLTITVNLWIPMAAARLSPQEAALEGEALLSRARQQLGLIPSSGAKTEARAMRIGELTLSYSLSKTGFAFLKGM